MSFASPTPKPSSMSGRPRSVVQIETIEALSGVSAGGYGYILLYSPSCPHCIRFAPVYSEAASVLAPWGIRLSQVTSRALHTMAGSGTARNPVVAALQNTPFVPTLFRVSRNGVADEVELTREISASSEALSRFILEREISSARSL